VITAHEKAHQVVVAAVAVLSASVNPPPSDVIGGLGPRFNGRWALVIRLGTVQ